MNAPFKAGAAAAALTSGVSVPHLTVWKYVLGEGGLKTNFTCLRVPRGAKPLSVERQRNTAVLYMQVNPRRPLVDQWIFGLGTGDPVPFGVDITQERFIGTVVLTDPERPEPAVDNSVWHYFLQDYEAVAADNVIRVPPDYWNGTVTTAPEFAVWKTANAIAA
jgi:hypothetical protein